MKIKHIQLETEGGQKINLSLDQARELYQELNSIFGPAYQPQFIPWYTDAPLSIPARTDISWVSGSEASCVTQGYQQ